MPGGAAASGAATRQSLYSDRVVLPAEGAPVGKGLVVGPALIAVEGSSVVAVETCSWEEARQAAASAELLDLRGLLIAPAFVNAHTHLALTALRGSVPAAAMAGDVVSDWFFRIEAALEPGDVRAFTRVAAYECLLNGVAEVWDHYYFGDEVAAALLDAGLGGVVAPTLQDVSGPGAARWQREWAATEAIAENAALAQAGVFAAFGPHATDSVSPELWQRVARAAERLELPVHAHVAQSVEEFRLARERHGCSPLELVARSGALASRALLVHALYASREDLGLLAPARNVLGFCPSAQAQFGFPADVTEWEQAGCDYVIATDCTPTNDSMNLQKELRLVAASVTQAITHGRAYRDFLRGPDLAAAARVEAARQHALRAAAAPNPSGSGASAALLSHVWQVPGALHPARRLGSIEPGARAHLAGWRLDHPSFWPAADELRALAFGDTSGALERLMVNGRWLPDSASPPAVIATRAEYREAVAEADARRQRLLSRAV